MLVVHPDRSSNADTETKFIAKRIFEAINEAYEEFLKKEVILRTLQQVYALLTMWLYHTYIIVVYHLEFIRLHCFLCLM